MATKKPAPKKRPRQKRVKPAFVDDPKMQAAVCASFAEHGTVLAASKECGVSCETIRLARRDNPDFAQAMEEAWEQFGEMVAAEVKRRAVDGWEEPVFQKGELIGHVRKFSDRLLELMAKRTNAEFKERVALEAKGTVNVDHQHTHTVTHNLAALTIEQQESLLAMLETMEKPVVIDGTAEQLTHSS